MEPRCIYKDMLDNMVSPSSCVSMSHQNQLAQIANEAMFAVPIVSTRCWAIRVVNELVQEELRLP
jgi:hypothetical protein